ncbi:HIT domain-containing protein [Kushneria marisflavi]|uniref:Histidine triad protein n=1 Tax=Kushneria marisflavi TaxID=157779 RepID=A0A240UU43_9GAMM|nr:HIT family protein [Kushneria marisflavi]ART64603.1 histidine triad protein [Kushneria marisflavi]RKD84019.1 diadenosine tetraphosphate (Ap4A) HIT family hydrolase [Kushneria marisflavi]
MAFALHERLAADTLLVASLELCELRLMNDTRFVWALLIPQREGIRESFELPTSERAQLWQEVDQLGAFMMRHTGADKINIGALGNMVPQLHVHVIARSQGDDAWPGPVWGSGQAQPLEEETRQTRLALLQRFADEFKGG